MIEVINFKDSIYPKFQCEGNAAQFAIPYALHVCKGNGLDVGCNRKEWAFPGATPVDLSFNEIDSEGKLIEAYNLPNGEYDYIFSSHMLEHVRDWVECLDYWSTKIKTGGTLFLYLPHYSQRYWRVFNNRKHVHTFSPSLLKDYLNERECWSNIFVSKRDLNNAFMVMAEKK